MTVTTTARASVIIPAHNEERVLARCLDSVLSGAAHGEFDVIVAANGCTDASVAIANSYMDRGVRVVTTDRVSKIAALNLGDAHAITAPRIYLDADVTVDTSALRALADALGSVDAPLAAAPRLSVDMHRSSRPARAYLRVWQSLPVFGASYVGSGCFALSEKGRSRFRDFPDVVADDRFISSIFARDEKRTLQEHRLVVTAPRTLRAIVRRSVRVRAGTVSLAPLMKTAGYEVADPGSSSGTRAHLLALACRPGTAGPTALFALAQVWICALSWLRQLAGREHLWIKDETSRT